MCVYSLCVCCLSNLILHLNSTLELEYGQCMDYICILLLTTKKLAYVNAFTAVFGISGWKS